MKSKIILMLIISSLIIGCIDSPKSKDIIQNNNETNLKIESEYYDCPSDLSSGSLSPEAYRKMGKIPPQCKKENSKSIMPSPIATTINVITDSQNSDALNTNKIIINSINNLSKKINNIASETKILQPEININILENRIHELINEKRHQNGISILKYDSILANIAQKHSQDMAVQNFFEHINLKGEDPSARGLKANFNCQKNYGSFYTYGIAENIMQNNLYDSVSYYNGIPVYNWNTLEEIAQSTVDGWMNSPGHRKNILTASYDKEGIGIAISSDDKVLITEDFC